MGCRRGLFLVYYYLPYNKYFKVNFYADDTISCDSDSDSVFDASQISLINHRFILAIKLKLWCSPHLLVSH